MKKPLKNMASNISVDEAKQIMRKAAKRSGYLDEEMMNVVGQWRADIRHEIDDTFMSMKNTLSNSVKTLVSPYISKIRN